MHTFFAILKHHPCRKTGTWKHAAVLEAEPTGNFAYPTPIQWEAGVVKVAYSVWGEGLRIATVRVPCKSRD